MAEGGTGAVGVEVVEMTESFEDPSLVASRALSHASLFRSSASMIVEF